tara:strand:+ start:1108 stop:1413 length:306 start_codon:yes stop_codon:yes gene_type:complete
MNNRATKNRSSAGEIEIKHKGKVFRTSVGSRLYESRYSGENNTEALGLVNGNIPSGYAHRPDLISNLFYNTPTQWWVICERNSIFDVFEQLDSGSVIRIPK